MLYSDYSEVVTVGAGADAVTFKPVSLCHKGDIVVTQDWRCRSDDSGKGAYGIHQNGKWYTNENIDRMPMETSREESEKCEEEASSERSVKKDRRR